MAYTAQQLVTLAAGICKVPGRVSEVGQFMNLILANYAQTVDEDVIRKTVNSGTSGWAAVIGPPPSLPYFWDLPVDYLRFYDAFYNIDGVVFQMKQIELADFDGEYTAQGIDNYPEWFATDMGQSSPPNSVPPLVALYPPPAIPLTITLRYRPQTADIAAPETSSTIPWFPNQLVLLQELVEKSLWLNPDGRSETFRKNAMEDMRKYLVMSDDKEGYSQTVKLDARTFRNNSNMPPSKKLGF